MALVSLPLLQLLLASTSLAKFCKEIKLESRQIQKTYPCCENISCDPPVCTKLETINYRVTRRTCCAGYLSVYQTPGDSQPSACLPSCPEGCDHGSCTAPSTCTCTGGWGGRRCSHQCRTFTWGPGCGGVCQCREEGSLGCHPETGVCVCRQGWQGRDCGARTTTSTTSTSTTTTSTTTTSTATATTIKSTSTTTTQTTSRPAASNVITSTSSTTPGGNRTGAGELEDSLKARGQGSLLSRQTEDLLVLVLGAVFLVLVLAAALLTALVCRQRMARLRARHGAGQGVRQGVVRAGEAAENIYQELEQPYYLQPVGLRVSMLECQEKLKQTPRHPDC